MWVCRVTRVLQILVRMEEVSLMIRSGTFDRFIVNLIRGSLIYRRSFDKNGKMEFGIC